MGKEPLPQSYPRGEARVGPLHEDDPRAPRVIINMIPRTCGAFNHRPTNLAVIQSRMCAGLSELIAASRVSPSPRELDAVADCAHTVQSLRLSKHDLHNGATPDVKRVP
ncbi:hypothetical protein GN244_ATG12902 [Phytophthora infestans]|uniref:Uncharacterized protein n=1 Tax=Phytophthora infestans TaxID=4787 RepID=A0A833T0Y3_PHYIN|nr:hypothetical protein GN244_ATG12902 [Phytophthora infestans]KAF4134688.1 hypothetical protein GN958_ATG15944 [Phytophthora infestans]